MRLASCRADRRPNAPSNQSPIAKLARTLQCCFMPATRTLFALAAAIAAGSQQSLPAELPSHIEVHPALEIRLFASEPDVIDPVALCFDAHGRMYVVEMRDYPYGMPPENKPGGTVRLLEDTRGDGRADRSVLFAEGLSFPTSIAPYRDGVIVAAPPEVIFLKDTDGDGKADVREVLLRGFVRQATDSNMSGLRWSLDNWLHGVNGGNGGDISSMRQRAEPIRLGDLDFRLKPDSGELETTYSTGGGFGLVFDEWGRSFTPHNVNHMQMRVMPARLLLRNPGLPPIEGTHSISDHGDMARIYAISEAQTRPNHPEQAGHFSSSGGVGFIGHQSYPGDLAGSVTVCDVVGNLVHRDVLSPDGPILKASRSPGEQTKEFIASTDPNFRPTALELGPDGALYLADMHREVIEHPDYIPKQMLEKQNIRAGDHRGRIYRLIPKAGVAQSQRKLSGLKPEELVEELASPNQWRRLTAQRLIVESKHLVATALLKDIVKTHPNALARVHALWTLQGLGELGERILLAALGDGDARVVENAIEATGGNVGPRSAVESRIQNLAINHSDGRIRFIAAGHVALSTDATARLLATDGEHRWTRLAALSALRGGEHQVLTGMLEQWQKPDAKVGGRNDIARELGSLLGARATADPLLHAISGLTNQPTTLTQSVMDGLREGLARRGVPVTSPETLASSLEARIKDAPLALRKSVWSVERLLGLPVPESQARAIASALRVSADVGKPVAARESAIQLLSLGTSEQFTPVLLPLFTSQTPVELQRAAFEVLRQPTDTAIARGLIESWREIHPTLKRNVALLLLGKRDYHAPLLDAIEKGRVQLGELNLDLEDRRRLISRSSPAIQERARKLIGDGEYGNRQAKVTEWLAKLPAKGDAEKGRVVFEALCASCHLVGRLGHEVGPNLTGQSHRSVEDLVSNILDPNMAINPNYLAVSIETKDGDLLTGLLAAENADAITLLQAQGIRTTLRRDQIKRQESGGISLMPEGLEGTMKPEALRDLVAFLQVPH